MNAAIDPRIIPVLDPEPNDDDVRIASVVAKLGGLKDSQIDGLALTYAVHRVDSARKGIKWAIKQQCQCCTGAPPVKSNKSAKPLYGHYDAGEGVEWECPATDIHAALAAHVAARTRPLVEMFIIVTDTLERILQTPVRPREVVDVSLVGAKRLDAATVVNDARALIAEMEGK